MMTKLGNLVLSARGASGLTPVELSDAANVPVSYVVGLELGWTGIPWDDLQRVVTVLGLSMGDIGETMG